MLHEFIHALIIGLAGAAALIVLAKIILSKLMRRDADFYEKREAEEERNMLSKADEPLPPGVARALPTEDDPHDAHHTGEVHA